MSARIAICCGVGGTGKTTTSAALAVAHAMAGEDVVVLTIDPARRLADALGVGALENVPKPVHVPGATGRLDALMLDRKGTWDQVIRRRAGPETAERLLANRYYRAVSTRLTGSHEYMAVEKLHELAVEGGYDLVVVDTPPTQHVVEFFRAPDRVRGILDRSMLKVLLDPGASIRGFATRGALGLVERLAGDRVMGDVREFFTLIGEMSAGFRERSAEVSKLLSSEQTKYWLVADADSPERNDLLGFLRELRQRDLSFAGFLLNRVQAAPTGPLPSVEAVRTAGADVPGWEDAVPVLLELPERARARAEAHRKAARALIREAGGGAPVWLVPEVPGGVRTITGLAALAEHLPPAPPAIR